ncbi:MAG: tRNA dihydrouridine synthase [Candidatus Coproplasma sp.]
MQLKRINVGSLQTQNNVFVAPLAGYTNSPFRVLCQTLGAGLTFTEMVSAKGLCYGSENTAELLKITDGYSGIKAVQLFGSEPDFMKRAATSEEIAPFELIDINMGCPVPKIFKNGEGSALLADIKKAQSLVKAAKASGKAVTVKFRIGITEGNFVTRDFAVAMEDAGADLITIHGRTRDKIYAGEVNFKEIANAKSAVKIPVIANGGVFSKEDADILINETGADGVMIARGVLYNPFLIAELTGTPVADKKKLILKQIDDCYNNYDSRYSTVTLRKMLAMYAKGAKHATKLRTTLIACTTKEQIIDILFSEEYTI